jgi:DNA adenine methylase
MRPTRFLGSVNTLAPLAPPTRVPEPFLSWAGGKRRLLPAIVPHIPESFGRYHEPFLGGGSLFFALRPEHSFLNDVDMALVETFSAIRDDVEGVISHLRRWSYNRSDYYRIRDEYRPRSPAARAARFVYLNKTCWNGLYRVNLNGHFNVPFGRRKTNSFLDVEQLRLASSALARAHLTHGDFERAVLAQARSGDLVYFDPPYVTTHNNNGFIEYNAKLFTWNDQLRLAGLARSLVARGVAVAITNAAHSPLRRLYPGFRKYLLRRHSTIASGPAFRRPCEELLLLGGT